MMNDSLAIWTIGHSTRTIDEFMDLLHRYEIEILVDVRRFPGSRRLPHFSESALERALGAARIRYEHMVELGGRRPSRPDSHNLLWRDASFRGYADYMETQPFRDAVDRVLEIARVGRTVVMCSEAVWWRCHRGMIADYLKAAGTRVFHILGLKRAQEHPYTSAARLAGGRLSYEHPLLTAHLRAEEVKSMVRNFKIGDHVEWNSEAGRVRGTIKKKITTEIKFKGYTVHASREAPQYLIKSDTTEHLAMHKGTALKKIRKRTMIRSRGAISRS